MDADGSEFFFLDSSAGESPYPGATRDALSRDTEVLAGMDQNFLQKTDEVYRAEVGTPFAGEITTQINENETKAVNMPSKSLVIS